MTKTRCAHLAENTSGTVVPQPAPDERRLTPPSSGACIDTTYDQLLLYQLPPSEQRAARDHYQNLTATLQAGDTTALKSWLANRIAALDVSALRCASLKDALLTADLSRKSVRSARDLDALAASSHRRLMDFLEVYMRLERKDHRPMVKIQNAENVAVVAGDSIHEKGDRK